MTRIYFYAAIISSLILFTGCINREIYESVYSTPKGGEILWGKTPSEMVDSKLQTPAGRYTTGDQWESWCYQVVKAGYLPSEIVCRPDGETKRRVTFNLKEIETHISSNPPGAQIYWGPSKDNLTKADMLTPWVEARVQIGANYNKWYFQAKKEGYRDSEVKLLPYATTDRSIHFVLVPIGVEE